MYRYASSGKQFAFRSDSPLSNDQIARHAPSVLATEAHASRGDRYAYIPTIQVLDGLRNEGFMPYEVRQTKVRDQSRREFTKHMVRLRHANQIVGNSEVPEIILINSHDGTSSYQLMAGVFRFVCSNGLIAGDVMEDIRIRHTGNVTGDVIEGCTRVLDNLQLVHERIDEYKSVTLNRDEELAFAKAALQLRYEENESPVMHSQLLQARRLDDRKGDLWTAFNRVQENLVRGGLRGRSASGRRMSTREVGGVNENVKLNKALWTLADQMAQLKNDQRTDAFVAQYEQAYAQ